MISIATFEAATSSPSYTLRLTVNEQSISVSGNTSVAAWSLDLINNSNSHFSDYGITATVVINGQTCLSSSASYSNSVGSTINLGSGGPTIAHESDGSKTISVAFSISMTKASYTPGNMSGSGSMALTTIPRATTPSISPTWVHMGEEITISLPRSSDSFTHNVSYSFGSLTGQTAGLSASSGVGTSCTFTPPVSLASQIPNAEYGGGTITVTTMNGSAQIGDPKTVSFFAVVPDSLNPSVSSGWASVTPGSDNSIVNGWAVAVQGYSCGTVTFDSSKITCYYGASVSSYKIACNGTTVSASPYKTPVFTSSGTNTITCTVTDSRGRSSVGTLSIDVYAYATPSFTEKTLYRSNSAGTESDDTGTCLYAKATSSVSSCNGKNTGTLSVTLYDHAGTSLNTAALTSGTGSVLFSGTLSVSASYSATITLKDTLGNSATYTVSIPSADVAFNIREGGNGAAFGKYAETDNLLDVDWNLKVGGTLSVGGKAVSDYVIGQGSTGIWTYRIWSGGQCEAWGTYSASNTISNAYNSVYYGTVGVTIPAIFASAPLAWVTILQGGTLMWPCVSGVSTSAVSYYIASPVQKTTAIAHTDYIYLRGTAAA